VTHPKAQGRILIASSAACTVGFATILVQPVLLAEILTSREMSEASAGFILTIEMLAVAVASALCTRVFVGKRFFAIALIGTTLAALGNGLSFVTTGYGALLATRLLCGLGEGAALMVSGAAPARLPEPERAYAKINTVTIVIGTLLVYITPAVGRFIAGPVIFVVLLLCSAVLTPAILLMPRTERFATLEAWDQGVAPRTLSTTMVLVWISFFAFVTINSAIFSFCAVIGERAGLSADGVSTAIAVATLASLVGCALAGLVGLRLGRVVPMVVGVIVVAVALVALSNAHNAATFWLATSVQMIGDYFLMPYFQGYAAEEDPTGRGVAAINASIPLSYAVGPFLGGVVAQEFGFGTLGWIAILVNLLVIGMVLSIQPALLARMRRLAARSAT